jgi:vitamin B12 transporter
MKKLLRRMMLFLMFILFLLLPGVGLAQENAAGTEEEEQKADTENEIEEKTILEDIVVNEKKTDKSIAAASVSAPKLKELGHHAEIISGEEMAAAGFVDLANALESLVPGLYVSTSQGRGGYNHIRIHGSNEILWLLDGIRISAIHASLSHPWSYTLSVHMIDHVEILKGGEGLFYGTGARGGIINIVTKDFTQDASGEFGSAFGEDGYREVYGHATETIKGHGLMAFGSYEGYDGYHVADDQAYADFLNTYGNKRIGSDRTTGGIKYQKEFDLAGTSFLNAQYRRQEGYFDYPYPQYRTARFDWNEDVSSLKWDHDVNTHFSYHFKAYLHRWWADLTTQNLDGSFMRDAEPVECDAHGVNLMTSTRWGGGHEVISGIDYRNYYGSFPWAYGGNDFDRAQDYGLFASYRPYLTFSPNTRLSLSARYTMNSEEADSTVWDVSLKTPIIGQTYLRGSVRTDFTLPTLGQLSVYNPDQNLYGNPDLDPEESFDAQVGLGGDWRYFHFDIGYFYNEVDNLIQTVVLDNGDTTYANVEGTTEIEGVEIAAGIGPFKGISLDASASWTNAEDGDTGEQLEQIPEFNATANLRYRFKGDRFGADLTTRYTGDTYERGLGDHPDVNYGDYFVVDASTFITFGKENRHRLTLRVENILDEEYASGYARARNIEDDYIVYQTHGLPRNAVLGYTYTF